jgi:DNA modification methylase
MLGNKKEREPMQIETLAITDLTPDPQNARQHDTKNLKAIEGSLAQFGQRKPIVITEANVIVAGNGTVTAAKNLGWQTIEAVRVPADWSKDQVKAFALADNRTAELATWSPEVLAAQLIELEDAGFEIAEFGFDKVDPPIDSDSLDEDELPEPPADPITKLGDLWQLGRHRLLCGDSTDANQIEKAMDGQTADVVFTDPPYGIDVISGSKSFGSVGGSNVVVANSYSPIIGDSTTETAKSFYLACKELGMKNFIVWGGNYFTDFLPPKKCWIVWDKKGRKWDDNFSDFEMAWTSFDKPAKILTHVWMGMVQSGERESRVHPTQKPANLVIDCLEYLQIGSKVFDGFGGSGSTLMACEKSNRTCYMMELDPKYCDVIIKRWETLTGLKAELVNATR